MSIDNIAISNINLDCLEVGVKAILSLIRAGEQVKDLESSLRWRGRHVNGIHNHDLRRGNATGRGQMPSAVRGALPALSPTFALSLLTTTLAGPSAACTTLRRGGSGWPRGKSVVEWVCPAHHFRVASLLAIAAVATLVRAVCAMASIGRVVGVTEPFACWGPTITLGCRPSTCSACSSLLISSAPPGPRAVLPGISAMGGWGIKVLDRAIGDTLSSRLALSEIEHGWAVKVLIPPQFVSNGCTECSIPLLGRVEAWRLPGSQCNLMVPLCKPPQPVKLFWPHSDVCSIDDKPSVRTVELMEPSKHFSVVIEELRRGDIKEEVNGPKNSEASPPMFKAWWAGEFLPVPSAVRLESPRQVRQLANHPLAMRAKEGEVCVRHKIGGHDLGNGANLLHSRLHILGRLSTPWLGILVEESSDTGLGQAL
jgi:hypothetical protein